MCALLVPLLVILGLLCIKPLNDALVVYSQKNLEVGTAFATLQSFQFLSGVVRCMPALAKGGKEMMVACGRSSVPDVLFTAAHGWEGVGIKALSDPGPAGLWVYSHAAVSKMVNDKDLTRRSDFFIASDTAAWVSTGWVPEGHFPLLSINRDTKDPVHHKFRDLMNDALPALMKPPTLNLADATGSQQAAAAAFTAKSGGAMVASYLFKAMFDFWPDQATLDDVAGWFEKAGPMAVGKGIPGSGPAGLLAFQRIAKHVEESAGGKQFLEKAAQSGIKEKDPKGMLHELLFIMLFAGNGGTGDTVKAMLSIIHNDEALVSVFWNDPKSFVLEAARLYPAVAGLGAVQHESSLMTLGNGRKYQVNKGDFFYNWNAGANVDPNVFGGADKSKERALEFDPKRENVDRMMTFNGEFGKILKCNTTAGCADTAARPCPGTRLATHTAVEVMKFLLNGAGKTKGAKSEL